MIKKKKLSSL